MIRRANTVIIIPDSQVGTLKVAFNAPDIEFPCVMFPIPNEATTAKNAKKSDV